MFNVKQSANACCCNKQVIVLICVCTGDNPRALNPRAIARGLFFRRDAQTIQLLSHIFIPGGKGV